MLWSCIWYGTAYWHRKGLRKGFCYGLYINIIYKKKYPFGFAFVYLKTKIQKPFVTILHDFCEGVFSSNKLQNKISSLI